MITRTNLVPNPSFEAGTATWTVARVALARVVHPGGFPVDLRAGSYCLEVTSTGTTGTGFAQIDTANRIAVVGGAPFDAYASAYSVTGRASVGVLFYNASGGYVGESWSDNGAAGERRGVSVVAPSLAATATIGLRVYSTAGGNPVSGEVAYFDRVICSAGTYFDGSTPARDNLAYSWTGTPNASASVEAIVKPSVVVEELPPSPAPSTGVTVVALGAAPSVFNVWRIAGGKRTLVRGGRNREAVDSDYLEDYEVPLNIPVTYELEILSGPGVVEQTFPGVITVESSVGWIQDPLVPSSAIPVDGYHRQDGMPVLVAPALSELLYQADVTLMQVIGSDAPVAMIGQRSIAAGVDFNMVTKAAEHSNDLRDLTMTGGILLVRPVAPWGGPLPALCYIAPGTVREGPRLSRAGDPNTSDWELKSPLVKAPSMDVLVPRWTWGDVEALWAAATWGQVETAMAGKTWLDVTKNPAGT